MKTHKVIIIDGTEQRTKRPGDNGYQKEIRADLKSGKPTFSWKQSGAWVYKAFLKEIKTMVSGLQTRMWMHGSEEQ